MRLIFVRHGPKQRLDGVADSELPLDPSATGSVLQLRTALEERQLLPRFIMTSRYRHAVETAELLRAGRTRSVVPVTALTPHTKEEAFTMATIVMEAWSAGIDLFDAGDVLMFVGHETRLSQLAGRCSRQAFTSQLAPLEALVIELGVSEVLRLQA
jgi:phosphohistidine phosphatase SixA